MPYIPEGGVATSGGRGAGITRFQLGEDYEKDTSVVYESGWYRARVDIEEAEEVPPQDPDNWEEFLSHGLESFGESIESESGGLAFTAGSIAADAQEGGLDFSTVNPDAGDFISGRFNQYSLPDNAINAGGVVAQNAEIASLGDFPAARATISSHRIESHEDGLVLTVPATDDFGITLHVNHSSSPQSLPTVVVTLQARVQTGAWHTLRSASHTITGTEPHTVSMNLTHDSDVSFTFDDGERITFRWAIQVEQNVGSRFIRGGSINPHSDARLTMQTSSNVRTEEIDANSLSGIPADIAILSDGALQAVQAGRTYTFPGAVNLAAWLSVDSKAAGDLAVTLQLQAKTQGAAAWTDLKSGTATVTATGNHSLTLTGTDESFALAVGTDEDLEFRWMLEVTGGYVGTTSIFLADTNRLTVTLDNQDRQVAVDVTALDDIPEAFATMADGHLVSRIDGLVIGIEADTFPVRFALASGALAPVGGGDLGIRFELQAKKVSDADWQEIGAHTTSISSPASANHDFALPLATDESFTLDDGEELEFRWNYRVTAGSITGGSIQQQSGERLGIEGTAAHPHSSLFIYGRGDNEGKIIVIVPEHDVETPVLDVANGVEYVGPTKLVGLADDLSDLELDTIQDKLGLVRQRSFKLGQDYEAFTSVAYGNSWYRAKVDITDASEVPPHDRDNWEEFFSHGIEGYGEHLEDDNGEVNFATAAVAASGQEGRLGFAVNHFAAGDAIAGEVNDLDLPNTTYNTGGVHFLPGQFGGLGDFPAALATLENHRIESHEDGLVLTAPASENFGVTMHVSHASGNPTIRVVLRGRVNEGTWHEIKSRTHILTASAPTSFNLDLREDSDVAFTLDDGDTLTLQWAVVISGANASIRDGSIQPQSGERLVFQTSSNTRTTDASVNLLAGIPADIVTFMAENGRLQPETDGLTYTFPGADDLAAAVTIPTKGSGDLSVTLQLQAKTVAGAVWTDLKSGTATVTATGNTPITLTGNDVSFDLGLDDDDELQFRWRYTVTGGYVGAAAVGPVVGHRLILQVNTPAFGVPVAVGGLTGIPESLATVDGGNIKARVDGLEIAVPHTVSFRARLMLSDSTPPAAGGSVRISVQLQAKKVADTAWVGLKSHTGDLANSGENSTNDFSMGLSTTKTFDLDTDEELEFRYNFHVTAGSIASGSLGVQPGHALSIEGSGTVGVVHLLVHGTGTYDGKIVVIDSETDTTTEIIDVGNGVEYTGPTKLAGLDSSLSAAEQQAIRTKLDVPAMADLTGATFITAANTSVSSNAYALTTGDSLSAYETGKEFIFVAEADADGALTVNIDGLGAKELHDSSGQLGDGDVSDGDVLRIVYNGTEFLVFESGDQNAAEVPTITTNFDGLLDSDPATVQSALEIIDDLDAGDLPTNASVFGGILGSGDGDVQQALRTIDDANAGDIPVSSSTWDGNLQKSGGIDDVQEALDAIDDLDLVSGSGSNSVKSNQVTGGGNAIALTPDPAIAAYADGQRFIFVSPITNTGSVTVNVSGRGVQAVRTSEGLLTGGELQSGDKYAIIYDTGSFLLVNPRVEEAAEAVSVDADDFDGFLSSSHDDVQAVAERLDELDADNLPGNRELRINVLTVSQVGGTANAITLSPSPAIEAYTQGQGFMFRATADSTGAVTINVSGLAAVSLRSADGAIPDGGGLYANEWYVVVYGQAFFLLLNRDRLVGANIALDTSGFDGTLDSTITNAQELADFINDLTVVEVNASKADADLGNLDSALTDDEQAEIGEKLRIPLLGPYVATDADEDSEEIAEWDDGTAFHGTHDFVISIAVNLSNDEIAAVDFVDGDYRTKPAGGTWSGRTELPSEETAVTGIDYDADGNIYVVGSGSDAVWRRESGSWTKVFDLDDAIDLPRGIAIHRATGNFFIPNFSDSIIYFYEADGTYNSAGNIDLSGNSLSLSDVFFDRNDNLLIAESDDVEVRIYRFDGTPGSSGGSLDPRRIEGPPGLPITVTHSVACLSNGDLVFSHASEDEYYTRPVTGWEWAVQASPELDEYREGVTIWATFPGATALDGNPPVEELAVDLSVDGLDPVPVNSRNGRLRLYDLHEGQRYPLVYDGSQFAIDLVDQLEISDFALGDEYRNDRIVRYQRVLYQATGEIDHASEIPPLDPDNWKEFSTHGIQGYGEIEDETAGTFVMSPVAALPNQGPDDTIARRVLHLMSPVDIPQGIVTIENGYFRARVDGTVLLFDADDDMAIRFWTYTENATTLDIDIEVSTDNANWSVLKSYSGTLPASAAVVLNDLTLSSTTDSSFTLDEDDELRLRIVIDVTAGEIQSPIVGAPAPADDQWVVKVTGVRETRHILAHGTGNTDGNIVVEDSTDGTITPIIDIDNGVEYVGPTKLAGLSDSLTDGEQEVIGSKLDLAIIGSEIGAITFTVRAALSETDNEVRDATGNNITEIQVSVDNADAEVRTADAILVYVGESAGWDELEGEFRVHSVSVAEYANDEGITITFTGQLTDIYGDELDPFTLGAAGDTVRIVFVERRPVTAYIPHQVGTDQRHHIITFDSSGKVEIADGNNVPTKLAGLADDLTEDEITAILLKLRSIKHAHFDVPREFALAIAEHPAINATPQTYTLTGSNMQMSFLHLKEQGSAQYAVLGRLTSSNSGGAGSVRTTLYVWDDDDNRYEAVDTDLNSDLTGFNTSDHEPLGWVSLPSQYEDYLVTGGVFIGIQASSGSSVEIAIRTVHSSLESLRQSFEETLSGVTEQTNVSHPSTFVNRLPYFAYRRPPAPPASPL